MVQETAHVSAKQILKWVLPFYHAGAKEVAGVHFDIHPCYDPMGGTLSVVLSLEAGPHNLVVLLCECRADLSGPIVVQGYAPGVWCSDLHRAAILAYDDYDDEA